MQDTFTTSTNTKEGNQTDYNFAERQVYQRPQTARHVRPTNHARVKTKNRSSDRRLDTDGKMMDDQMKTNSNSDYNYPFIINMDSNQNNSPEPDHE